MYGFSATASKIFCALFGAFFGELFCASPFSVPELKVIENPRPSVKKEPIKRFDQFKQFKKLRNEDGENFPQPLPKVVRGSQSNSRELRFHHKGHKEHKEKKKQPGTIWSRELICKRVCRFAAVAIAPASFACWLRWKSTLYSKSSPVQTGQSRLSGISVCFWISLNSEVTLYPSSEAVVEILRPAPPLCGRIFRPQTELVEIFDPFLRRKFFTAVLRRGGQTF